MALTTEQLQGICEKSIPVIKSAGHFIREELGKVSSGEIEEKSLNSLVSYVDKTAEERLVDGLRAILPESGFITEEETVAQETRQLSWIIDPLDGTTNFLFQIPVFSVSVALQKEGELVLGIVYEINRDECFYAWKEGGAFLNGQPIKVSGRETLAQSLIATGFPYYDYSRTPKYMEVLTTLMQSTRGIRRLGSAAVDLAYVACGRFDAFYEYSLHIWDVAAGILLVREAGGVVSDFQGKEKDLNGAEIVAGNPSVHKECRAIVGKAFY
jgi:myo-inositol-1(or 4)-monophosphatase